MNLRRILAGCAAAVVSVGAGGMAYSQSLAGAPKSARYLELAETGQQRSQVPTSSLVAEYQQIAALAASSRAAYFKAGEAPLTRFRVDGAAPRLYNGAEEPLWGSRALHLGQKGPTGVTPRVGSEVQSLDKASGSSVCSTPGYSCSLNWSGLEDWQPRTSATDFTGGNFSGVSAQWTVPTVAPTTDDFQDSSTWIGLDGDPVFDANANTPLIQIGTDSPSEGGQEYYEAWYELLPGSIIPLFPVEPGDQMTAVISQAGSPGSWDLAISDSRNNIAQFAWAASNVSYSSPGRSADWVEEATSYCDPTTNVCGVTPLQNFGSVTFTDMEYSVSGQNGQMEGTTDPYSELDYMTGPGSNLLDYPTVSTGQNSLTVANGTPPAPPSVTGPTTGQGAISGTVTAGSSPQSGVCVYAIGSNKVAEYETTTGSDGNFDFGDVVPDSYNIQADPTCQGTLTSPYAIEYSGGSDYPSAVPIAITPAYSSTSTAITLPDANSIAGVLTGPGSSAVVGACVEALATDETVVNSTTTGTGGNYTISNLPVGSYVLLFDPTCIAADEPGATDAIQFSGGSGTFAGATSVPVNTDAEDASLAAGQSISGTLSASGATYGFGDICVYAEDPANNEVVLSTYTGPNGYYELTNLPSDNYDVDFDPTCEGTVLTDYSAAYYGSDPVTAGTPNVDAVLATNVTAPSVVTTSPLAPAVVDGTYFLDLQAAGGVPGWIWSVTGLPAGLNYYDPGSADDEYAGGFIYGAPEVSGTFTIDVQAFDSSNEGLAPLSSLVVQLSLSVSAATTTTTSGGSIGGGGGFPIIAATTTTTTTTTSPTTTSTATVTPTTTTPVPAPKDTPKGTYGTPLTGALEQSGLRLTLRSGLAKAVLWVPPGALPLGTRVALASVTDATALLKDLPAGESYLVSFSISWLAPNGTSPKASKPLLLTITDPTIKVGDIIYMLTPHGVQTVGTATVGGTITITFTTDPNLLLASVPRITGVGKSAQWKHGAIDVTIACGRGAKCTGAGEVTVRTGKGRTVHTVGLAAGSFVVPAAQDKVVAFSETSAGAVFFGSDAGTQVAATLTLHVLGGKTTTYHVLVH